MIILDTNVLSAMMRNDTDPRLIAWLDAHPPDRFWLTTITVFEIRFGLELLPDGGKRRDLERAFAQALSLDFQGRVLGFDTRAADEAAILAAKRRITGSSVDIRDTQIAGIALAHRAMLATRNVRHFEGLAVEVVNPWVAANLTS